MKLRSGEDLDLLVLTALYSQPRYGYQLRLFLVSMSDERLRPALTSLYGILRRLAAAGFVTSRRGSPTNTRGGRPRHYYAITAKGRSELARRRDLLLSAWKWAGL